MQPAYFLASTLNLNQDPIILSDDEAHHAIKVRRTNIGEKIFVTDGNGLVVEALVTKIGPGNRLEAQVLNKQNQIIQSPIICVAQAIAKGDRADLSIELLTEVGVDQIIPWQANRCISKLEDKSDKLIQKWQNTSRESTKQSRRALVPQILDLVTTSQLVNLFNKYEKVVILDPDSDNKFIDTVKSVTKNVLLVIGPEGGIDDSEMQSFKNANANFTSLGNSILRTSSAGAISSAILLANTKWLK